MVKVVVKIISKRCFHGIIKVAIINRIGVPAASIVGASKESPIANPITLRYIPMILVNKILVIVMKLNSIV